MLVGLNQAGFRTMLRGGNLAKSSVPVTGVYYGWIVVAAMIAIGGMTMIITGPTFSLFIDPMQEDLGFSTALFGWANTARILTAAASGLFIGKLLDRHGPRILLAIAGSVTALVAISLGFFHPAWWLIGAFIAMGLVAMQGPASFYTSPSVAKWFVRDRAKALGILSIAAPAGLVLGFPAIEWVIGKYGWQAGWVVMGLSSIVVIIPVSLIFLRRQPEDIGLLPDGDIPSKDEATGDALVSRATTEHQWTRAEAIRTREFWQLSTVFSLFVLATNSMLIFRVVHFVSHGVDPSLIAWGAGSAQLGAILGAVTMGRQVAFAGLERLSALTILIMAVCFVLTVSIATPLMMFVAMYTWSWANNMMGALQGTLFASYFGRRHAGAIRSVSLTANMLFAAVAAPLAGRVNDVTGSFNAIWWPMTGVLCLAAFLMVTSRPPRVRDEALPHMP